MNVSLIIVGAGKGERFGKPKADILLAGRPLMEHILDAVKGLEWITQVLFVGKDDYEGVQTIVGGQTRAESVSNGLKTATGDLVMVHNLANPLASQDDFRNLYEVLVKERCVGFVGQPVVDTLRKMKNENEGSETINRNGMWRVQTPQGFYREDIVNSHEESDKELTDDVACVEHLGIPVVALPTHPMNVKITYPEDLEMMEQYLGNDVRVGIGEDAHAFVTTGKDALRRVPTLVIGGIKVPDHPKLKANSDGDVILHALFNAISSAMGRGSLGPTADPLCADGVTDSKQYLQLILDEMMSSGYRLGNVSISLECARPKIEPIASELKKSLSRILNLNENEIGLTSHSGDELSSYSKGDGIRCLCSVTLCR